MLKDKKTRESKGVAFILFLTEEEAKNCVTLFDGKQVFLSFDTFKYVSESFVTFAGECCSKTNLQIGGRTIRVKIAVDNGRSREFIKKRIYTDKSKCYECGEDGHLSYECPKNTLGYRKPPPKKKKKKPEIAPKVKTFILILPYMKLNEVKKKN